MTRSRLAVRFLLPVLAVLAIANGPAFGEDEAPETVRELLADATLKTGEPDAVQFQRDPDSGLQVSIEPGTKGTPGVGLSPGSVDSWDLSSFSRVEAIVRNDGEVPIPVSLRVDNDGHWKDAPWNTESIRLAPGERGKLVVFFDYQYGFQPGYDLDPAGVRQLLFFTQGAERARGFTIESVRAAGKAGQTPEEWQQARLVAPPEGHLLGGSAEPVSEKQFAAMDGARIETTADPGGFRVRFDGAAQSVRFHPAEGAWNLSDYFQVALSLRNTGDEPVQPAVRLFSSRGETALAFPEKPVPAGATGRIVIPFASPLPWTPTEEDTDPAFVSREVESIAFYSGEISAPVEFEITAILAESPTLEIPDSEASGPTVPGEWELTFQEEFDGESLDTERWNVASANYWDKRSHFSEANVIVSDGVARLRFERRPGRHNDDPREARTDYATGFLDTFGKWTQRYGYFEARMKLPTAPGLWPAFWMMPDRGPASAERWKREQTTDGGMEFDIMEHLTRWGPHRYNVAFHWDGYDKGHRSAGTSGVYGRHDAEGFLTAGLLWQPGEAVYFCNGREVGRWKSDRICDVPMLIRFTHVSGGWDNDSLDDARLPDDFVIDYVRCWQRKE